MLSGQFWYWVLVHGVRKSRVQLHGSLDLGFSFNALNYFSFK
jgi:hypothetical protein